MRGLLGKPGGTRTLPDQRGALRALQKAAGTDFASLILGADSKKPGTQEVFGVPFDVDGLVENIGLERG